MAWYVRTLVISLWCLCMAAVSQAADMPFYIMWDPVTTRTNGALTQVKHYVVYACDREIQQNSQPRPIRCEGSMQTFTTTNTELDGLYRNAPRRGYLFFAVTAVDHKGLESQMSRLRTLQMGRGDRYDDD